MKNRFSYSNENWNILANIHNRTNGEELTEEKLEKNSI